MKETIKLIGKFVEKTPLWIGILLAILIAIMGSISGIAIAKMLSITISFPTLLGIAILCIIIFLTIILMAVKVKNSEYIEAIEKATKKLNQTVTKIGEPMKKAAQKDSEKKMKTLDGQNLDNLVSKVINQTGTVTETEIELAQGIVYDFIEMGELVLTTLSYSAEYGKITEHCKKWREYYNKYYEYQAPETRFHNQRNWLFLEELVGELGINSEQFVERFKSICQYHD